MRFGFDKFLESHKQCKFSSTLGFDFLVQSYLQSTRVLDVVIVVKLMLANSLFPEVRTLSTLLNGLLRIRKFILFWEIFYESVNAGVKPNPYTCFAEQYRDVLL
jgi:pentatricopeptide repeat protein